MADFRTEAFQPELEGPVQPPNPTAPSLSMASPEVYRDLASIDRATIDAAYEYCRQITKRGSKGFYFASRFLPASKRRAIWAVYNFCRFTDDMVDNAAGTSSEELRSRLADWQIELHRSFEGRVKPNLPHMVAWHHTAQTFNIPSGPPLELIEGVRMDLSQSRYASFEELRLYCYRVASTVGLMASEIIGYSQPIALQYAVELGIAMQLTNILRDVGEDSRIGRIYLPLDEMARFGYTEAELLRGEINDRFVALMQFQIERARQHYRRGVPGIEYLDPACRLSITIAAQLYSRILDVIERNNYDVFTRRAFVPTGEKLQCLAGTWLGRRIGRPPTIATVRPSSVSIHEEADA